MYPRPAGAIWVALVARAGAWMAASSKRLKPGVQSAEAGTCMELYPTWLCPTLPLELEAQGVARDPHVLYDDDADGIEAERRAEAKRLRQLKKER